MKKFLFLLVFVFFLTIAKPIGDKPRVQLFRPLKNGVYTLSTWPSHTYDEIILFLIEDNVNFNKYVPGYYVCRHFALDLRENACQKGHTVYRVLLELGDDYWHEIVAFHTVDAGIIFVEPQTDEILSWEHLTRYKNILLIPYP